MTIERNKLASPVFTRNNNFQTSPPVGFNAADSGDVMTLDNSLRKTILTFTVLVAAAAVGWVFPILMIPGLIVGLVFGLINAFKKEPSPVMIMIYAVAEGFAIGGLSAILEVENPGIVTQAVLATLSVIAVTLVLYKTGLVKATPKMTKVVIIAMLGYLLFSLVNLGLMATGVLTDAWGLRGGVEIFGIPLGIILGVFAVLLGAYSLIMDFTFIDNGVANRLPERYGWTAAFGITVTVVWIYVEILRMLAILRR